MSESRPAPARALDRKGADTPPWWAEGGSERCPFCLQSYAYEVEVRCADCDRPSCPHCAVVERHTAVVRRCPDCPECAEEEG
jgi:hypothetical protein